MRPDDAIGTCPNCGAELVQRLATTRLLPGQSRSRLIFDDPECPEGCPRPTPDQLPLDELGS